MKTINFFLAALLLSVFVMQTSAQAFTFNSGTGVITGLDPANPSPTTVTIPDEISAVKVRGIGKDAFSGKTSITSLVFNTTLLDSIGMGSFRGCTGLTSITIPTSVTKIGFWAFQNCNNVTAVSFTAPSSLTYIGQGGFEAMSKLTSIAIPNTVSTILGYSFYNCTGLTTVTLPNTISSIPDNVFINCSSLNNITIPSSVTTIGVNTFLNNTSLTSIIIPNNVTNIKDGAFDNCRIATLTFSPTSKVSNIGVNAFRSNRLTSLSLPASLVTIGAFAFKANALLTSVDLNTVTSIGDVAFQYCTELTSISIPNTVTTIGAYAFDGCTKLGTLTFASGSTVSTIKNNAFAGTKLTSISIPNSVSSIGIWAFSNCSLLSDVSFSTGSSLLNINQFTFRNNPALRNVTLSNSLLHIRQGAFENSGLLTITIPASVDSIGNYAFINCANFTTLRVLKDVAPLPNLGFSPLLNTSASLAIYVPAAVLNDYKTKWTEYTSKIVADTPTAIENRAENVLKLSYNSTGDYLKIVGARGGNLQIVNMVGQTMHQISNLSESEYINTNELKYGYYIVNVQYMDIQKTFKILKY